MENLKTINAERGKPLCIGREGENNARQVVFDLSSWQRTYGPGTVQLLVQRTGETTPYPAALMVDGNRALWTITAADTQIPGQMGKAELRYLVNDILAKSETWTTIVLDALGEPSETPPEPQKGWVDQVLRAGAEAQAAAAQAQADADKAAQIAADMAVLAEQVSQDTATASQAKTDALTAQSKAEAAQSAAETARQAAEDASSATSSDAATAAQAAARAEAAAGQATAALADLQALYQQMQEYVAQAIQAIQAEGDTQVQRVIAEGNAQTAAAKQYADQAEDAAVRQPYPNAETRTWWIWDSEAGAYKDTGITTSGVYVGSGDMPEGYNVQIDPDGTPDLAHETWTFTLEDGTNVTKVVVLQ